MIRITFFFISVALMIGAVHADFFGSGSNEFSMAFVDIGYPENVGDLNHTNDGLFGAVDYVYSMGATEVSVDQFAKAFAVDSRIGDGDEGYWNDGTRTVGGDAPVSYCSWFEAAKFANWLTSGDAFSGAYQFDTNGVLMGVDREMALASYGKIYVLPTEDEWYKTAYYRPVNDGSYSKYSDGANSVPIQGSTNGWNYLDSYPTNGTVNPQPNYMWESGYGALEQNGTYDMCGNIWEWCESAWDGLLDNMDEGRMIRQGSALDDGIHMASYSYRHSGFNPLNENKLVGIRIAALPASRAWVKVSTSGNGSVNITDGWYSFGTQLNFVATPSGNWLFNGWSGGFSGDASNASTNVMINGDLSVTAVFVADTDGDGLPDDWESANGLNPLVNDAALDPDFDGLINQDEYAAGTHPLDGDSDGDTFGDGLELSNGGNPLESDLWRVDYIRANGHAYDLYSSNSVLDIEIGQAGFLVSNGMAWLSLQLEQSDDLVSWTNAGEEIRWSIPVDSSNSFYRVRSQR